MLVIDYNLTGTGWAKCEISDGKNSITISASYLGDALASLGQAALDILNSKNEAYAFFDEEPGEYRLFFQLQDDNVQITIFEFKELWGNKKDEEGKVIFKQIYPISEFKTAIQNCFKKVLDTYTIEGYKAKWSEHDFPNEIYKQLISIN